jgi:hypothetical protein
MSCCLLIVKMMLFLSFWMKWIYGKWVYFEKQENYFVSVLENFWKTILIVGCVFESGLVVHNNDLVCVWSNGEKLVMIGVSKLCLFLKNNGFWMIQILVVFPRVFWSFLNCFCELETWPFDPSFRDEDFGEWRVSIG